jgi:hypothetical protein
MLPDRPERIYHVSQTQLSIARHYGGAKVFGAEYVYDPTTDTLIRSDVLQREQKAKRDAEREARREAKRLKDEAAKRQGELFS